MTVQVSVLMPVLNSIQYVDAAVESILSQTFPDFQFVIVDNGSTDGTWSRLVDYASSDRRIELMSCAIPGISHALNAGLARCSGDWVARIDSDDIALPNRIARQLRFLEENPDLVLSGTFAHMIGHSGRVVGKSRVGPVTREELDIMRRRHNINFLHPSVMYSRKVVTSLGGYSHNYPAGEDYHLWNRIGQQWSVLTLPEVLIQYRVHDRSTGTASMRRQAKSWEHVHTDMIREANGLPPLSSDDFELTFFSRPLSRRVQWELSLRSRRFYRIGGARLADGKLSGLPWIAGSLLLWPPVPISRFWRQVIHPQLQGRK